LDWSAEFYRKQSQWLGVYDGSVSASDRSRAAALKKYPGTSLLELGPGGGQFAVAAAQEGFSVTAVELVPELAEQCRRRALGQRLDLRVMEGDFLHVDLDERFDLICYWDGFGVGSDRQQQMLLSRIKKWLQPNGHALLDVYTPWYWAQEAGRQSCVGSYRRLAEFDGRHCRMLDTWWPEGCYQERITQSLRCYAPADFEALAGAEGLATAGLTPGGALDHCRGDYISQVPLEKAMSYEACLVHKRGRGQTWCS